MNLLRHMYQAIKHGEWHAGWTMYKNKPTFGAYHDWIDGHHAVIHVYKLYVGVSY